MAGQMPEPDRIYLALGTGGTAVGLMIGLRAAGLKSRLVAVRVVAESSMNAPRLAALYAEVAAFLRGLDPLFPVHEQAGEAIEMVDGYLGAGYAAFTEAGMQAVARMGACERLKLDGTYTGKALAALIDDAGRQALKDEVVLFWNTLNARVFSDAIASVDYRVLPRPFHRYFGRDVQPLDRDS